MSRRPQRPPLFPICLLSLICVLIIAATVPAMVRAQATPNADSSTPEAGSTTPAFLLEPVGQDGTYLEVETEPGSETELTVALGNAGSHDVSARTYVADAYSLVNGGFGVRSEDEPATGATTWLDYPAETIDLPADKKVERTFTVAVPDDASPGQYVSGLVLQTAEPIAVGGSGMLRQNIVKAIAVVITVPGAISPALEIGAASLKQSPVSNSLLVEIENTGNILLKPAGTVTMTTEAGESIVTAPVAMGSVYAGTATLLEMPIPTTVAAGTYQVSVVLTDEETGATASAESLTLEVEEFADSATPTLPPVTIEGFTVEPLRDPATDNLQAVNVMVTLANEGAPVPSARLTLHVTRDGELVEDFPLNAALVVANGTTDVQQRYLPLEGWEEGTYEFAVTLEAVDANTGQVTVLATAAAADPVTGP